MLCNSDIECWLQVGLAQLIEAHSEQSAVAWVCLRWRRQISVNLRLQAQPCHSSCFVLVPDVFVLPLQTLAYAAPEVLMDEKCVFHSHRCRADYMKHHQ